MTNTVNQLTIDQPSTQVVVQSTLLAAGKTALQAFAGATFLQVLAILANLQSEVLAGNLPDMDDVNALGLLMYSGALAAVAAVISFAWNTWFAKTLPAGKSINASAS